MHWALHPNCLEHPISCAANSHHVPSHRTCNMICTVDVCSCALDIRLQSVALGHECFSPAHSRRRIQSLSVFHVSSSVSPFDHFSHSTHCRHTRIGIHNAHHVVVLRFLLVWTCLLRPLLLPPKFWFAAVKFNLLLLFSAACNLIDCVNVHGLVLDWRSRT